MVLMDQHVILLEISHTVTTNTQNHSTLTEKAFGAKQMLLSVADGYFLRHPTKTYR
jgi:hypothetical protein